MAGVSMIDLSHCWELNPSIETVDFKHKHDQAETNNTLSERAQPFSSVLVKANVETADAAISSANVDDAKSKAATFQKFSRDSYAAGANAAKRR